MIEDFDFVFLIDNLPICEGYLKPCCAEIQLFILYVTTENVVWYVVVLVIVVFVACGCCCFVLLALQCVKCLRINYDKII